MVGLFRGTLIPWMPSVNFNILFSWMAFFKAHGANANYKDFMESSNTIKNQKLIYQGNVLIIKCPFGKFTMVIVWQVFFRI